MNLIEIRKAKIKDIDSLVPMYLEFMNHHGRLDPFLEIKKNSKKEAQDYLRKTIYGRETTLLVAMAKDKIIGLIGAGFAKLPPIYKNRTYGIIFDAFVAEEYRRQGVGSLLVGYIMEWFKEKNVHRIELGVMAKNIIANKTWEELGFKNVFYRKRKVI